MSRTPVNDSLAPRVAPVSGLSHIASIPLSDFAQLWTRRHELKHQRLQCPHSGQVYPISPLHNKRSCRDCMTSSSIDQMLPVDLHKDAHRHQLPSLAHPQAESLWNFRSVLCVIGTYVFLHATSRIHCIPLLYYCIRIFSRT